VRYVFAIVALSLASNPHLQGASLKVAREEITKAIAIIERTKWR
jgi:hypothetical protein